MLFHDALCCYISQVIILMEKLESTGYTWEEAPQNLKNAAVKLASGLNITPVEAYKLLLEKITEQDLKNV